MAGEAHPDVIVVDDEPVIVTVVEEALADAGITAEGCPLGWKAHQWIRSQQPKVVIFDVAMPLVNGIQLFHLLRTDPQTAHIPVIFFTAYPNRLREEIPYLDTMDAELLPKPFNILELQRRVAGKLAA